MCHWPDTKNQKEKERLGEWEPQPSELMNIDDAFQFKKLLKIILCIPITRLGLPTDLSFVCLLLLFSLRMFCNQPESYLDIQHLSNSCILPFPLSILSLMIGCVSTPTKPMANTNRTGMIQLQIFLLCSSFSNKVSNFVFGKRLTVSTQLSHLCHFYIYCFIE